MADPFIGEIRLFAFNFAPNGWAQCNGQLLSIAQNTALFSLLGTQYGGDGRTTFALPDLRGRVPMHMGQGPGLSPRTIGETLGEEAHTLVQSEMPQHNHQVLASSAAGTQVAASGSFIASGTPTSNATFARDTADVALNSNSIAMAGGSQAHNVMQPSLTLNFCISLVGIFPPRS